MPIVGKRELEMEQFNKKMTDSTGILLIYVTHFLPLPISVTDTLYLQLSDSPLCLEHGRMEVKRRDEQVVRKYKILWYFSGREISI